MTTQPKHTPRRKYIATADDHWVYLDGVPSIHAYNYSKRVAAMWNSHKALLAAAKALVAWCEHIQDDASRAPADEMEQARIAVAAAEKEP